MVQATGTVETNNIVTVSMITTKWIKFWFIFQVCFILCAVTLSVPQGKSPCASRDVSISLYTVKLATGIKTQSWFCEIAAVSQSVVDSPCCFYIAFQSPITYSRSFNSSIAFLVSVFFGWGGCFNKKSADDKWFGKWRWLYWCREKKVK